MMNLFLLNLKFLFRFHFCFWVNRFIHPNFFNFSFFAGRLFYDVGWLQIFTILLTYRLVIFWWTLILSRLRIIPSNDIELIKIFALLKKKLFFRILTSLNLWFFKLFDFLFFQTLFLRFTTKILTLLLTDVFFSRFWFKFLFPSKKLIFIIWTWIFVFFPPFLFEILENYRKLNRQIKWMDEIHNAQFLFSYLWEKFWLKHWAFAL
jgi:hypothetical protein